MTYQDVQFMCTKGVFWTHPNLDQILNKIPLEAKTLVDVGCGRGIVGAMFRIYRDAGFSVGIDGFSPYLAEAKRFYDQVECCDLVDWAPKGSFDVGTCIEVLEHLPKPIGRSVLKKMESCCGRVIVTTPISFHRQDSYDGNPMQHHVSFWSEQEFASMGYQVERKRWRIRFLDRDIGLISRGLAKFFGPAVDQRVMWKDIRK